MRSTGVGWALGIGRIGSIVGPLVGGVMIANHVGVEALFLTAAIPALCACLAAFALGKIAAPAAPVGEQLTK
jgi:AAHS family 4-hydroxybenzoate transporter-like MFS transporter